MKNNDKANFSIKFSAVFQIIIGAIFCFSPVTLIIGILLIIAGAILLNFNSETNSSSSAEIPGGLVNYFRLQSIIFLLIIAIFLILLLITLFSSTALLGMFSGLTRNLSYPTYNFWQY
ncbi:MAG: hypothetical protein APR63_09575 [Desulfuromonas sp. SDB]|nr:MAG: hypothetical protein APR63_09575 [Desulfuromonas sp. SDB]